MDDYTLRMMMKERMADRQRAAAVERLRRSGRPPRPGVRAMAWEALGNILIRLGRKIKAKYGLGQDPLEASGCRSRV